MESKYINKRNNYLSILIVFIGLFFSGIFIIRAFNESKIYEGISENRVVNKNSILGQKIIKIQNTIQANDAMKKQEYEKALQLITGNTSEDYYNRGSIQTILAYKNALQSEVSGLETAQIFITQAQKNFDIAKDLSDSSITTKAIINNKNTISSLSTVIDIKTCYGIGQKIITNLNNIVATIKNIKTTLDEENIYITKRAKTLDSDCYQKLQSILDTSKNQVGLIQLQIQKDTINYTSDFSNKIENPMICIQTPYENIIPSIIKGNEGLKSYQQQHINTIEALKSNDNQSIKELCNQTKNDAQINQKIDDAIQELLQKLEDNKHKDKEQQKSRNEIQYKDFFNENEKKILDDIKKTNQGRIDTILNIRGKGNYNPERYIDDMFNQFYGNSGDFINLHK